MATYYVTKVRKETVMGQHPHRHIIGVYTNTNNYYTNQQVVDSIEAGNEWYTNVSGEPLAKIKKESYCPATLCYHKPYLKTAPDHTTKNNLENLPEVFYVTKVRKETVTGQHPHRHIVGVITDANYYYTNQQVVDSIEAGNEWYTYISGEPLAKIKKESYCPAALCYHKPYLTTAPDHTTKNNLDNLPEG